MDVNSYREILKHYWGYDDFRGVQREIIESIGSGHDTLGLMPTGGGKSITFQVPAMAKYGLCIVITPLIALMKDQVQHLRNLGIKATAVNSEMTHDEIIGALENCILGEYKFLYVSPERLESELFQKKLSHMRINFITVDEAHCISQWGYDFRPSYLQIAQIRDILPDVPILALTATATPEVMDDIQKQLHFRDSRVIRMSFERKNLTYIVRQAANKFQELLHILRSVDGSAIVYTRSRQQTLEIAEALVAEGISATNYHAGLAQILRDDRQERWHNNQFRVMVATNAFGLGIDKPDVRLVVHFEMPNSPEEYFQEAGRAGRDGKQAYAVLIYERRDCAKLTRRIEDTYPDLAFVREVYEHMCFYFQMAVDDGQGVTREFDLSEFCLRFQHFPVRVHYALLLLNNAGYISYQEPDEIVSRLKFVVSRDNLYRIREQEPSRERVINFCLRKYSGLFVNFVNIDENLIAYETGLSVNEVYQALKMLAHIGIIDYIAHKRTNYITFRQRRVETERISLPPLVYKDRKRQYDKRINAMIQYVTDPEVCHARFLLNYFGETTARDCGKCDVCRSNSSKKLGDEEIRKSIVEQLSHCPLHADEMDTTGFSHERFAQVIRKMLQEEELSIDEQQRFLLRSD